jgi:hypothetical protein
LDIEPQPEPYTFFLDKGLGKFSVATAMRAIGLKVETYAECYPGKDRIREGGDQKWLVEVGRRGRVILTKDKNIRRNQVEIAALLMSGAPAFALTSGSISGEQMGKILVKAMPEIHRFLATYPPPYVTIVHGSSRVEMLLSATDLAARLSKPDQPEAGSV